MPKEKLTEKQENKVGRPPLYSNPEDLQEKIDEYFSTGRRMRKVIIGKGENRKEVEIPVITISGLVRYCGFCNRASFYDYENREEFSNTIKAARNRIEEEYEELLQQGLGVGAIFALKNFGWVDKTEHEMSGPDGAPLIPPMVIFKDKETVNPTEGTGNAPQ
jgi:hypothetical protein